MRSYFLPLALLFIAFTNPSIAQTGAGAGAEEPAGAGAGAGAGAPLPGGVLPELVRFKLYQPLAFNCSPDFPTAGVKYQWYKNNSLIEGIGSNLKSGPVLEENGAVLVYKRAFEDDYGNYTCNIGDSVARAWEARAQSLARVPPNTNVVEGQKFSITCKLIGKPYERVRWLYAPDEASNSTELQLEGRFGARDSPAGVPGGVLEVADAKREDAGIYECLPEGGSAGSEGAVSVLRVKDVYAALWPFLGICLEVFILCAIILVYEKRRTKPEMEDSDADTHDQ